jgi:molybdopterin/thiamine biosynthesis adenylyltransferase
MTIDRSLRDRYSRQTILPEIGDEGQAKLLASTAVIIGCGALGCTIAGVLARAGVGKIRIIDRDFIEYHNLQRQVLFTENDIKMGLPKAVAAERYLKTVNSTIDVQGIVADTNFSNIEKLCEGAHIILDGLDNRDTRLLINDYALKHLVPWVYGGAIATYGMTMNIIPGKTPCWRCIHGDVGTEMQGPTCESAGVINTMPVIIGAIQATEAIKILTGSPDVNKDLIMIDIWRNTFEHFKIERRKECPACNGHYEFLEKRFDLKTTSLCGQRRAVQILDMSRGNTDLAKTSKRLQDFRNVCLNEYYLSFDIDDRQIVIFPDSRIIIKNTIDEAEAEKIYKEIVAPLLVPAGHSPGSRF